MRFHDISTDRKAQAGSALARGIGANLCREKRLEDAAKIGRGDALARIGHANFGGSAGRIGSDPDSKQSAVRHGLAGVDHEIEQDLLNLRDSRGQTAGRRPKIQF